MACVGSRGGGGGVGTRRVRFASGPGSRQPFTRCVSSGLKRVVFSSSGGSIFRVSSSVGMIVFTRLNHRRPAAWGGSRASVRDYSGRGGRVNYASATGWQPRAGADYGVKRGVPVTPGCATFDNSGLTLGTGWHRLLSG